MANQLLTISMITRESLRVLENRLTFTKGVNREYDDQFARSGAKIGNTINIRKPPRYLGRVGQGLQIEDATETSVPLTLATQRGCDISFSSADMALSVDDFSKRFIAPAIANVASAIDYDGLQQYVNVYNSVGTPGTVPSTLLLYLQAGQKLDEEAAPRDDERSVVMSPAMQATLVDALKGLFHASTEIEQQYKEGTMGLSAGFKFSMDQNCGVQAIGGASNILAGTVNGTAGQTGSSLVTTGWTHSVNILNKGDVFSFNGVYAVNPQNKQSTGSLREFVATAAVSSDSSGNATIPISPAITITGGFQTVNAAPAASAAIYSYASSTNGGAGTTGSPYGGTNSAQGLAWHRDAFALGCADLPLPGGVDMASRVADKQLGISLRMVRAYDINTDRLPCRIDVLYGWVTLYQELACRILS